MTTTTGGCDGDHGGGDLTGASGMPRPDLSDESFWDKVRRFARAAGGQVIETALILFFALRDPDTPAWAKTLIVGALTYFVLPTDAIPDLIPVVGYSDDLGALVAALGTVSVHVKPEHEAKAKERVRRLFGDGEAAA